jgi:opacity protein-like surface antigen
MQCTPRFWQNEPNRPRKPAKYKEINELAMRFARTNGGVRPRTPGRDQKRADVTRTGFTAGVGFEYIFLPNWGAFVEYDFMGFGTKTVPFTAPSGSFSETWDIRQNVQVVLVGLNFHFNFGKAPAAGPAKY